MVESKKSNGLGGDSEIPNSAEKTTASARVRPIEGGCQVGGVRLGPNLRGNAISATFVGARGAIGALRVHNIKF